MTINKLLVAALITSAINPAFLINAEDGAMASEIIINEYEWSINNTTDWENVVNELMESLKDVRGRWYQGTETFNETTYTPETIENLLNVMNKVPDYLLNTDFIDDLTPIPDKESPFEPQFAKVKADLIFYSDLSQELLDAIQDLEVHLPNGWTEELANDFLFKVAPEFFEALEEARSSYREASEILLLPYPENLLNQLQEAMLPLYEYRDGVEIGIGIDYDRAPEEQFSELREEIAWLIEQNNILKLAIDTFDFNTSLPLPEIEIPTVEVAITRLEALLEQKNNLITTGELVANDFTKTSWEVFESAMINTENFIKIFKDAETNIFNIANEEVIQEINEAYLALATAYDNLELAIIVEIPEVTLPTPMIPEIEKEEPAPSNPQTNNAHNQLPQSGQFSSSAPFVGIGLLSLAELIKKFNIKK